MDPKKQEELSLLDGQLVASLLFFVNLGIAVLLLYNQKLNIAGEEPLFDDDTARDIALWNKVFAIILLLYFLYVSYIAYEETKDGEGGNDAALQLLSSSLVVIAAVIGLYVIVKNYPGEFPFIDIENPEI